MNLGLNEIKLLQGQPWSAWKKIVEEALSDLETEETDKLKNESSSAEPACCKKLLRSDMAIYGSCPKTETFELAVCDYCENKYKVPALADHIKRRHSGIVGSSPKRIKCDQLEKEKEKSTFIKGKTKKVKDNSPLITKNVTDNTFYINNDKVQFVKLVNDEIPIIDLESEIVPQFNQIDLQLQSDSNCLENDYTKEGTDVSTKEGNSCAIISNLNNEIVSNNIEPNIFKAHIKIHSPKFPKEADIVEMQPIVQLSPLSAYPLTNSNHQLPVLIEEKKKLIENNCNSTSYTNGSIEKSIFNPELVDKENTVPNAQLLNCSYSTKKKKHVSFRNSKSSELFVNDRNTVNESNQLSEECFSNINLDNEKLTTPPSTPSSCKLQSTDSPEIKIDKTDNVNGTGRKVHKKINKRIKNDKPRLSLPVSITNPTILCQLQKEVIPTNFNIPIVINHENVGSDSNTPCVPTEITCTVLGSEANECPILEECIQKHNEEWIEISAMEEEEEEEVKGVDLDVIFYDRKGGLLYDIGINPEWNNSEFETTTPSRSQELHVPLIAQKRDESNHAGRDSINCYNSVLNDTSFNKIHVNIDYRINDHYVLPKIASTYNNLESNLYNNKNKNNLNETVISKRTNSHININGPVSSPPSKIQKFEDYSFFENSYSELDSQFFSMDFNDFPVSSEIQTNGELPSDHDQHFPSPDFLGFPGKIHDNREFRESEGFRNKTKVGRVSFRPYKGYYTPAYRGGTYCFLRLPHAKKLDADIDSPRSTFSCNSEEFYFQESPINRNHQLLSQCTFMERNTQIYFSEMMNNFNQNNIICST